MWPDALVGSDLEWSGARSEGALTGADQLGSSFRRPISHSQRQRSSIVSHIAAAIILLQRRTAAISMLTRLTGACDHRCLLLFALLAADPLNKPSPHSLCLSFSAPSDGPCFISPLSEQ